MISSLCMGIIIYFATTYSNKDNFNHEVNRCIPINYYEFIKNKISYYFIVVLLTFRHFYDCFSLIHFIILFKITISSPIHYITFNIPVSKIREKERKKQREREREREVEYHNFFIIEFL